MVTVRDAEMADQIAGRYGCEVLIAGWPDLLVMSPQGPIAAEIKRGRDTLRPAQKRMAEVFSTALRIPFVVIEDYHVPNGPGRPDYRIRRVLPWRDNAVETAWRLEIDMWWHP
jgi:hypothetical protein